MLRRKIEGSICFIIPLILIFTTKLAFDLNPSPASLRRVDVVGLGYFVSTFIMVVIEIVLIHDWWTKPGNRRNKNQE